MFKLLANTVIFSAIVLSGAMALGGKALTAAAECSIHVWWNDEDEMQRLCIGDCPSPQTCPAQPDSDTIGNETSYFCACAGTGDPYPQRCFSTLTYNSTTEGWSIDCNSECTSGCDPEVWSEIVGTEVVTPICSDCD